MPSVDHIRETQANGSDTLPTFIRSRTQVKPFCPLCGDGDTAHAFTENGCALRKCATCGLFFVHPYPEGLQQHARVSSGESTEIEILDCMRRREGERLYYQRHFDLIADECCGAKSLLDVGCGTGYLLEQFSSRASLYTAGIELNAEAARHARRTSGRPIYEVPFEEFRSDRKFDAITMINVLSHVPSFDGMFRSLRAALRPGGKIILRTSEMGGNVSRWNQVHWGIPDDLHFLGLGTLDFLCAKYGFVITRHIRTPFEEELFLRSRWEQVGRSRLHNFIKLVGVRAPFVLPILRKLYTATLGQRLFISFAVLTPIDLRNKSFKGSRQSFQELLDTTEIN